MILIKLGFFRMDWIRSLINVRQFSNLTGSQMKVVWTTSFLSKKPCNSLVVFKSNLIENFHVLIVLTFIKFQLEHTKLMNFFNFLLFSDQKSSSQPSWSNNFSKNRDFKCYNYPILRSNKLIKKSKCNTVCLKKVANKIWFYKIYNFKNWEISVKQRIYFL